MDGVTTTQFALAPAGTQALRTRDLILDISERAFMLLMCGWLVYRFLPSLDAHPFTRLLLASELLIGLFVVIRRFGPSVNTGRAWTVAIVGTCAPLLVQPGGEALVPLPYYAFCMAFGLMLSLCAKLFLFRSFGMVAANRGVQRLGPYRLVRHPMYLGYLFAHAGFLASCFSAWNVLVYAACWLGMLLRIEAEEGILSQDPAYRSYSADVPYRLLPGLW